MRSIYPHHPWLLSWCNPLKWRHNRRDSVWNHQPHDCLHNRLFRRRSKKTPALLAFEALRHWPLCGKSTGTGEFPAQMASYVENVSIWWRHHVNDFPQRAWLKLTSANHSTTRRSASHVYISLGELLLLVTPTKISAVEILLMPICTFFTSMHDIILLQLAWADAQK